MAVQASMRGARLAYVVVPIDGTCRRTKINLTTTARNKDGKATMIDRKEKTVEEPFGFMVYFPRGHAIRVKDEATLAHYNLTGPAQFINMTGLDDPNSPVGKLIRAQDQQQRAGIMADIEQNVIKMVEHKVGKVIRDGDVRYNKEAA